MISFTEGKSTPFIIPVSEKSIDIQGHRGARGILPENSLEGFLAAVKLGVTTLEMDVVITSDNEVLVSHEPWYSAKICQTNGGKQIYESNEKDYNVLRTSYESNLMFDCGSKGNPDFPEQNKQAIQKPLLKDVIKEVESYTAGAKLPPVHYNIEIKSKPEWDKVYTPEPKTFAKLVMDVVNAGNITDRTSIQSFDPRSLNEVKALDPNIKIALLVEKIGSIKDNLKTLGFTPDIYSPYHVLVNEEMIKEAHSLQMKIIPWTVNEEKIMQKLVDKGVDGFITDYPNRAVPLFNKSE